MILLDETALTNLTLQDIDSCGAKIREMVFGFDKLNPYAHSLLFRLDVPYVEPEGSYLKANWGINFTWIFGTQHLSFVRTRDWLDDADFNQDKLSLKSPVKINPIHNETSCKVNYLIHHINPNLSLQEVAWRIRSQCKYFYFNLNESLS